MRAGIRSLCKEERGVSVVIGAMLMLLIMATLYGTIQAYHVPIWNKDVEFEHLNVVHDDMMTFKSDVEDVALSGESKSSNIQMGVRYPNRIFLANPGPGVAGALTSETVEVLIEYTIDGGEPITESYNSNRIIYEVQGTVDSPKLVYEHGVIIRDYGSASATTDEQSLIVGDEIYIPVLTGDLTAASSMETESIALKPLSQSYSCTNIQSANITLSTDYPAVWEQLLAGTSTAVWPVNVTIGTSEIEITSTEVIIISTAIRQISFPMVDITADALYAGMIDFNTTSASESAFIIGGGTGLDNLKKNSARYVPMFNAGRSATESDVQQSMPMAGTVSDFYVILDTGPGNGKSYTFVVRKNGDNTPAPVTCTISDTDTTGYDLANSVDFNIGDLISIMATPSSGNPTESAMSWTAKFSPSQ